jgi:hypothetical protein
VGFARVDRLWSGRWKVNPLFFGFLLLRTFQTAGRKHPAALSFITTKLRRPTWFTGAGHAKRMRPIQHQARLLVTRGSHQTADEKSKFWFNFQNIFPKSGAPFLPSATFFPFHSNSWKRTSKTLRLNGYRLF